MNDTYDESYKDQKYFVDGHMYNCPFCNRRHVSYKITKRFSFDWSKEKVVWGYITQCLSCKKESLHLSNFSWPDAYDNSFVWSPDNLSDEDKRKYSAEDLDKYFFYHKPTSFFVIDNRIPEVIRTLISEAEGCRDIGYMTGASGALRKAIYEFLKIAKLSSSTYEDKIKELKEKYPHIPPEYIDALANIQGMVSTQLHENFEYSSWNAEEFTYFISALRELMIEIFVKPEERKSKLSTIIGLNPYKSLNKKS